jgi:hypothetical protein
VAAGCVGGLVPDLLRVVKAPTGGLPPASSLVLSVIAQVALGGIVAAFLGPETLKESFVYGFTAPEILSRLLAKQQEQPHPPGGPVGGGSPSIRHWWRA